MADALCVIPSVTKVLVGGNELGDQGATVLCDALRASKVTKVQELDLSPTTISAQREQRLWRLWQPS